MSDGGSWIGSPTLTPLGPIGVSGGLRDRLIYQSVYECLRASLGGLGWFDPTIHDTPPGTRQHQPVHLLAKQQDWNEQVPANTIAFFPETDTDREWELGSDARENRKIYYCDVFGENEMISVNLAGDLKDILRGKISTIQRGGGPVVDIFHWDAATPYKLGYLWLENVSVTRAPVFEERWQKFMRTIRFEALDYYNTDLDTALWAFDP